MGHPHELGQTKKKNMTTTILNRMTTHQGRVLRMLLFLLLVMAGAGGAWGAETSATVKMTYVDYNNPTTSQGEIAADSPAETGYNKITNNVVGFGSTSWNINYIAYLQVDASAVLAANGEITNVTLKFDATGSGGSDKNRASLFGVGYNSSAWSSTMTYETADKSIITLDETKYTTSTKYDTWDAEKLEFDITDAFANDDDGIVTIIVYDLSADHSYIKNPEAVVTYNPYYSYTVKSSIGTTIATGNGIATNTISYYYPQYILKDHELYEATKQGSNPWYGTTFELTSDNQEVTHTYTKVGDGSKRFVFYREGEDIAGATAYSSGNADIRCSGGKGGAFPANTKLVTLPAGAYQIRGQVWGNSGTTFSITAGDGGTVLWSQGTTGSLVYSTSATFQLADATDLYVSRAGDKSHVLDNVYIEALFAYEDVSSASTQGDKNEKPTLFNPSGNAISNYESSNGWVATVDADGIDMLHNGTSTITITEATTGYYTKHTVIVTGETTAVANPWSYDSGNKKETYTLTGTGYIDNSTGTTISIDYGSDAETQTVASGEANCVRDNGTQWHASLAGTDGKYGLPGWGTYYVFTPSENGTLTINARVIDDNGTRNGIRLVDSDGNVIERIHSDNVTNALTDYSFNTLLMAGKKYYVFAETGAMRKDDTSDGDLEYACTTAYCTLLLHSFTFTQMEGTTISLIDQSLLFTTETNSNRKQLDRTIPRFTLEFGGGDGAKYTGGGIFVLRNASETNNDESQNGKITITPRFASGSTFAITGVTLNIGSKAENKEDDPATKPIISVNGVEKSVSANSNISWSSSDLSSADNSKLEIQLKGSTKSSTKNKIQVYLNSITFNYSTTSTTLDDSKGTIDLRSAASSTYIYGYEGDDVENDTYFFQPHAFSGDVTFEYEGDGFAEATTTVKKLLDTDNVAGLSGSDAEVKGLIHFGENDIDSNNDGKLDSYDKYKVHIGSGVGKLTASFAATDYFAASTATTRLYSRDYEESPAKVLAAGDSYTWPAGNGMTFEITTTEAGTITLNGGENITMTAGEVYKYTVVSADNKVVVTNEGASNITISKVKTYRKSAELDFGYRGAVGAGSDVLYNSTTSYTPNTFTISSEAEASVASKYKATGTYAITQDVTGVSINKWTGVISVTDGAANGVLKVTLTVNPENEYKATYAPLTKTLELKVVDGVWDFRTYSNAEHLTMSNSTGWYTSGWYVARDNAEFADILRNEANNNTPLPRALALQTMGKHRLLHSDHGYLHLQGKGIGGNASANGGGQLRVPVKAGMLVEVNSYSGDLLSEMEIDGVTDIEGNDVTMFYVNPSPASQYFLAKSDGYIIVRNPSTNLDLHICYINVSADMVFKYGEEDESGNIITYVDAGAGKWTNPVMNQGTTTIEYSYVNNINAPVTSIDEETGEVTLGGAYGKFTGTATGSGTGLLAGKTGSYIAYSVGVTATGLSRTISESNEFELKDRIGIDVGNITETEASVTEANLKDKVVFSLVNPSPSLTLSGSTLTIGEVGTVTVKATLGSIEKTFTCSVTGGTLADGLNPVIANDATSYTITLTGTDIGLASGKTVYFDVDKMKAGALGDVKSIVDNSTVTFTENTEAKTLTISNLGGKGGVIPIYVNYRYNNTTDYTIEGTLTVAYTSHVWRFQHNLLTGMDSAGEDAEEAADKLSSTALAGYGSAHGLTGGLGGWQTANNSKTAAWDVDYATIDEPTDNGTKSNNYNWKFVRKIGGHTESPIIYYYNHAVEGQNALVIPETEGLQLFASPSNKQLGVSMARDEAPYDCRNLMLLRGGKLTIPLLKKGQWVEVRWTRHKEEMGERILMTNLSDVDGTAITSTYKIGNCFYNLPWSTSTYMFQATADGDVTFEVADNIYVSIQEIILHDPDKDVWPFKSSISTTLKGYDDATTPSSDWTGLTAPDVKWVYLWNDDAASHTLTFLTKDFQNAPNAPQKWTFELDDMLKREGAVMTTTGVDNGEATLTYNGGWGKAKVTMTCYSQNMKYVANKKTWTLTFGQAPKQTYPYTWDFTKFFASTLGSTTNENSWAAVAYAGSTTSTTNPLRVALYNNHTVSNYGAGGYANTYNTDDYQSYYVEGGQLVSYGLRNTNNGIVPETAGLGFILDVDGDANQQPDQNMLMLNMTNNITSAQQAVNGQTWITDTGDSDAEKHTDNSHLTIGSGGKVIVPKPNDEDNYANYYIYIKSSHEPSGYTNVVKMVNESAGANEVVDEDYDVPTDEGVYKYRFNANEDAVFTFTSSDEATDGQLHSYIAPVGDRKYTDIYAIAVTKDYKTVKRLNGVGWATESRDYAVDYSLDSLLTTRPLQAYSVIARSSNPIYSVNKTKTTVRLQDRNYVVPASQGLVLKQVTNSPGENGSTYTVPLFVPAVTTATEPDYTFTNNLMRPNLNERTFTTECENADGTDNGSGEYTRFILSEKYMTWRKEGDAAASYDTQFTSGTVPGFYRLHIYGDIDYDDTETGGFDHLTGTNRNILGANKAYLVLPSDKINSPIWQASAPARASYFIGIEDVSDMEEITEVTEAPANNATYNLSGQRVADDSTLSPGIYIINGRKVIVK